MNLVDSSGWIEYFLDGPNAEIFASPLKDIDRLLVPTICIFEVFKNVLKFKGREEALQIATQMEQGKIIGLDIPLSLEAAKLSLELRLAMADSIILAVARTHQATLWTQDTDFKNMDGVRFISKGK